MSINAYNSFDPIFVPDIATANYFCYFFFFNFFFFVWNLKLHRKKKKTTKKKKGEMKGKKNTNQKWD